ncbi:MAG TPA: SCO family protein [Ktedonobacteraceae bacterium]|nr:SCO family protein [Ktedonobacteraceae bacterium]
MNWRLASRLSVLTLAVLVVIVVALAGARARGFSSNNTPDVASTQDSSGLQGTGLGGGPAPDFRLTDQFGRTVSLSQFKGKPVIVTFLYTHCPDQCPLTAEKLHAVMQNLGSNAQNVAVLAVSTDPKGDTTASALNFSKVHKMENYWHYLVGTHDQLSPIWSSYSVYAAPAPSSTGGSVTHNTAIFVLDKQGHERVYLDETASIAQLTTDMQILLKE